MSPFLPSDRVTLYARVFIPLDLRLFFHGRAEVWRSLRTADKDLAQVRADKWKTSAKGLFFTLKRYGHSMTKEQIEALVTRWLDARLELAEDYRASLRPISDDQRYGAWHVLHDQLEDAAGDLLSNDFRRTEKEAEELLRAAGLPRLDPDSMEYGRLCRRLLMAKLDYAQIEMERWEGTYRDSSSRLPRTTAVSPQSEPSTAKPSKLVPSDLGRSQRLAEPTQSDSKRFSEVAKLYYEENPPRSERSGRQVQAELQRFIKFIGDGPIGEITKDQCRAYKEDLLKTRRLALITVGKWLGIVATVFRWAIRQGYVPDHFRNPLEGLAPNTNARRRRPRLIEITPMQNCSPSLDLNCFDNNAMKDPIGIGWY